jgi:hypothetical protein
MWRRRRYRRKPRRLWDGRYKPYYVMLNLDDFTTKYKMSKKEFMFRWWEFLEDIENLLKDNPN